MSTLADFRSFGPTSAEPMPLTSFDPQVWSNREDAVAARVPARLLRGLFTRSVAMPPHTAALVVGEDNSRRLASAGETVPLDGTDRLIFVRTGTLDVRFDLARLFGSDGHPMEGHLRLSVRVGRHDTDLLAVEERLIDTADTADRAVLRRALDATVVETVRAYCAQRPTGELMTGRQREPLEAALLEGCRKSAFQAGLELIRLESLQWDSPAWREQIAAENRSRKAVEDLKLREEIERRKLDGQAARVERLENLAARLDGLREKFPGLSIEALIGRADETQRGELFETLLGLYPDAQPCRRLYVAAGRAVYGFDPPDFAVPADTQYAPPQLGAVRAVRILPAGPGVNDLVIGCQFGLYLLPGDGTAPREYPLPAMARRRQLRGGVNAVARSGDLLFGTHSEVGVLVWRVGRPSREGRIVRPPLPSPEAVRGLVSDAMGRLIFTWDQHILRLDPLKLPALVGSDASQQRLVAVGSAVGAERAGNASAVPAPAAPTTSAANSLAADALLSGSADSLLRVQDVGKAPPPSSVLSSVAAGVNRVVLPEDSAADQEPVAVDAKIAIEKFASAGGSEITCILPMDGFLYAGNAAGQLLRWRLDDPSLPPEQLERSTHKIYSLAYALLGNVGRLLIGDNDYAVRARVPGQDQESRYRLTAGPVCFAAGSSDFLFAIDATQGHIYVWRTTEFDKPISDIAIRKLTQHSAKDIAVLTGSPESRK